jgi:hypothetical protein
VRGNIIRLIFQIFLSFMKQSVKEFLDYININCLSEFEIRISPLISLFHPEFFACFVLYEGIEKELCMRIASLA